MSTFMGLAWIDLVPGADPAAALAALRAARDGDWLTLDAVELADGRRRIEACLAGTSYWQLADLVVRQAADVLSHAFVAFDHDEYGSMTTMAIVIRPQ